MRDTQQRKVYKAENPVIDRTDYFKSGAEIQAFVNEVFSDPFIAANFPGHVRPKVVISGKLSARAYCKRVGFGGIPMFSLHFPARLDPFLYSRMVLLHEMAHCLQEFHPDVDDAELRRGHFWNFCATYLMLVKKFDSSQKAAELERNFKLNGVRYRSPRTRTARAPMSFEQREAAAARAEKARFVRDQKRRILGFCRQNGYQQVYYLYGKIAHNAHPLAKKYSYTEREWLGYVLDKHIYPEVQRRCTGNVTRITPRG